MALSRGAAAEYLAVETAPEVANIRRALIAVVALRVADAAAIDRSVMALVERVAEVVRAWVRVITVFDTSAARGYLCLTTCIVGREAYSLRARVVVSWAIGRLKAAPIDGVMCA